MIGRTVSHYRVTEKLGGGGMGVVYRAHDTHLDRDVALKFLPAHLSTEGEARERFIQEAKAASALDHPNICTIHDVDVSEEGELFIAMAFYEGETLKNKLAGGSLPEEQALDIARQVAAGLSVAHQRGIIHRDIKPANLFVTTESRVVILDFGLAKLAGAADITRSGSTLGTAAYMSPEQTRGEAVDHRTDIWSLGVVLYEMLSGEKPFSGDYEQAVSYAIVNIEPRMDDAWGSVGGVLRKLLAKNPDDRYKDADEFLREAESLSGIYRHKNIRTQRHRIEFLVLAVAVGVLVGIVLVLQFASDAVPTPSVTSTRRITGFQGFETRPAYSPDMSRVAYVSDASGNYDIWIHEIESQRNTNVTADHLGFDGAPAWSPDGTSIAFFSDREGGGIFVSNLVDDEVRAVAAGLPSLANESSIAWSPDGSTLVFSSTLNLYTVPAAGGPLHLLSIPAEVPLVEIGDVAWSTDGERIFVVAEAGSGVTTSTIISMRPDGTETLRITDGLSHNRNPVMNPHGNGFYFLSDRSGTPEIWYSRLDASGRRSGDPARLTTGVGVGAFSVSADGRKVVYAEQVDRSNIWAIPLTQEPITFEGARAITNENHFIELLDVSADGAWIAFDSFRGGNTDIWRVRTSGEDLGRVTSDPAHDWAPTWTPDMSQILFHSLRAGNRDVWSLSLESGKPVQLTNDPAQEYTPMMSPDGSEIVFLSSRDGGTDAWIMAADGTSQRQLTRFGGRSSLWWYPLWSPGGEYITFASDLSGEYELYLVPARGGSIQRLTNAAWPRAFPFWWFGDGSAILACVASTAGSEKMDVWRVFVPDGTVRRLTDFSRERLSLTNADTDGETLYGVFTEHTGDLWEMEIATE